MLLWVSYPSKICLRFWRSVEFRVIFIAITLRFTLTGAVVPATVSSISQTDLFKNYRSLCVKDKTKTLRK